MAIHGSVFRCMFLILCACISYPERTSQALPLSNSSNATNKTSVESSTAAGNTPKSEVTGYLSTVYLPHSRASPDITVPQAFTADTSTRPHDSCSLVSVRDVQYTIDKNLRADAKLVELNLTLKDYPTDFLQQQLQGLFIPSRWFRTSGRGGRNLLLLKEEYQVMSLAFLSIGIYEEDVILTDSPQGCLMNLNKTETLAVLRNVILNNFQPNQETGANGDLSYKGHVCNRKIKDNDGIAKFPYECCYKSFDGVLICEELRNDFWVVVLYFSLKTVMVLVFLYSPSFLPKSLYRHLHYTKEYVFRFPDDTPVKRFTMVITQDPAKYGNQDKVVQKSKVEGMQHFKTKIDTMHNDMVYEVTFDEIRLLVKSRRLLDENHVPGGLLQNICNNLVRCRIRHLEPFKNCCDTKIFGQLSYSVNVPWRKVMRGVAQLLVLLIFIGLWAIRVWFYYEYEENMVKSKAQAAEEMGLEADCHDYIICNWSPCNYYMIPVYIILIVGLLCFCKIKKIKIEILNCLMGIKERSHTMFFVWCAELFVMPFQRFGLIGLVIFIFYVVPMLLVELVVGIFYLVPVGNLILRLLKKICCICKCGPCLKDNLEECLFKVNTDPTQEATEVTAGATTAAGRAMFGKGCLLQIGTSVMCLLILGCFGLLLALFVFFVLEIVAYTLIGIIVNADSTLKYISIVFLTLFYGRSYLNDVWKMYFSYYKKIISHLLKLKLTEMNEMAPRRTEVKENTAMCVHEENVANIRLVIEKGRPMWRTSSILLFLDRQGTVHIPEKFFYDATKLEHCDAPGPPVRQYRHALWNFSHILLFLLLVFIVVMAFGDAYKVSTTNQLLITVAGSLIPLIFLNVFRNRTGTLTIHTDKMPFDVQISHAVRCFMQTWPAPDVIIKNRCEIDLDQQDGFSEGSLDLVIEDSTPASRSHESPQDRGQDAGSVPMRDLDNLNRSGGGSAPIDNPSSTSNTSERDNVV